MSKAGEKPTLDSRNSILLLCLAAAGFAGNFLALHLFTGFYYLFGSIATLMTVRLFGMRWGLTVAAISSAWTVVLFGHPYAMAWLCLEAIFVGYLLRRGTSGNIILYDAVYWPLLGAPLIWLFFRYVMHMPLLDTAAALLMYWVIGITNALAASLLLSLFPGLSGTRAANPARTVPILAIILNLMMATVAIPAVIIMVIHGRDVEQRVLHEAPFSHYQRALFKEHVNSLSAVLILQLVTLASSLVASRRLSTPLRRISQITTDLPERLMRGKIDSWPSSMIAEVDQLINNFKVMADVFEQKFQEITYANETLEQRVDKRAQELTRANNELEREIAGHRLTEIQRDRLMRELQKKNKELEEIIYIASHDLRSPLVNVQGFSRRLTKNCAEIDRIISAPDLHDQEQGRLQVILRENIPKLLEFIIGSVEKMDHLLNGLLRISRLGREAVSYETLDIPAIMSKIVASMTFQIEAAGALLEVGSLDDCVADAVQLNQVFSNLLDNAVKYRSPDRRLVIQVSSEPCPEGIRYCFADNGIGISPEHQDRIWEIFHRVNDSAVPGEGLGLTIARRIIDRLGGSISIESEPGRGSRFYVILPKPPASE